jgi:HPt (histidine-containing phosphotransfer) domain-containing protein
MIDVINGFVAALPGRVAEILKLLDEGNRSGLLTAVHRLKGAGGGYGFSPISDCAASAESKLKDGSNADEVAAAVEELVNLIRRVEGYDREGEAARVDSASAA